MASDPSEALGGVTPTTVVEVPNPDALEQEYFRAIRQRVQRAGDYFIDVLNEIFEILPDRGDFTGSVDDFRRDAKRPFEPEDVERVGEILNGVPVAYQGQVVVDPSDMIAEAGGKIQDWNRERNAEAFGTVLGLNVEDMMGGPNIDERLRQFEADNLDLIRDLDRQLIDDFTGEVRKSVENGSRHEVFAKRVARRLDVGESRARLIARDQTSKLNSNLNQLRQRNMGVRRYEWRTSLDERVRPSHRSKHGQEFSWDDPPADTGHPGDDVQCRCTARAIIEDITEGRQRARQTLQESAFLPDPGEVRQPGDEDMGELLYNPTDDDEEFLDVSDAAFVPRDMFADGVPERPIRYVYGRPRGRALTVADIEIIDNALPDHVRNFDKGKVQGLTKRLLDATPDEKARILGQNPPVLLDGQPMTRRDREILGAIKGARATDEVVGLDISTTHAKAVVGDLRAQSPLAARRKLLQASGWDLEAGDSATNDLVRASDYWTRELIDREGPKIINLDDVSDVQLSDEDPVFSGGFMGADPIDLDDIPPDRVPRGRATVFKGVDGSWRAATEFDAFNLRRARRQGERLEVTVIEPEDAFRVTNDANIRKVLAEMPKDTAIDLDTKIEQVRKVWRRLNPRALNDMVANGAKGLRFQSVHYQVDNDLGQRMKDAALGGRRVALSDAERGRLSQLDFMEMSPNERSKYGWQKAFDQLSEMAREMDPPEQDVREAMARLTRGDEMPPVIVEGTQDNWRDIHQGAEMLEAARRLRRAGNDVEIPVLNETLPQSKFIQRIGERTGQDISARVGRMKAITEVTNNKLGAKARIPQFDVSEDGRAIDAMQPGIASNDEMDAALHALRSGMMKDTRVFTEDELDKFLTPEGKWKDLTGMEMAMYDIPEDTKDAVLTRYVKMGREGHRDAYRGMPLLVDETGKPVDGIANNAIAAQARDMGRRIPVYDIEMSELQDRARALDDAGVTLDDLPAGIKANAKRQLRAYADNNHELAALTFYDDEDAVPKILAPQHNQLQQASGYASKLLDIAENKLKQSRTPDPGDAVDDDDLPVIVEAMDDAQRREAAEQADELPLDAEPGDEQYDELVRKRFKENRRAIREGEFTDAGPVPGGGGTNESAFVRSDLTDRKYIIKPEAGANNRLKNQWGMPSLARREEAAARIDGLLPGPPIVPSTTMKPAIRPPGSKAGTVNAVLSTVDEAPTSLSKGDAAGGVFAIRHRDSMGLSAADQLSDIAKQLGDESLMTNDPVLMIRNPTPRPGQPSVYPMTDIDAVAFAKADDDHPVVIFEHSWVGKQYRTEADKWADILDVDKTDLQLGRTRAMHNVDEFNQQDARAEFISMAPDPDDAEIEEVEDIAEPLRFGGREIESEVSIQEVVPFDSDSPGRGKYGPNEIMAGVSERGVQRLVTLDAVTANSDRHDGNILWRSVDGELWPIAIDNGFNMGERIGNRMTKAANHSAELFRDNPFLMRMNEVDLERVGAALADSGISSKRSKEVMVRIAAIQENPNVIHDRSTGRSWGDKLREFQRDVQRRPGSLISDDKRERINQILRDWFNSSFDTATDTPPDITS